MSTDKKANEKSVAVAGVAVTAASKDFIITVLSMFLDKSALMLAVPPAALLGYMDLPKLLTLLEWMLYAAVIAGFAIQISQFVFPQIKLNALIDRAGETPSGAATVIASVVVFVGLLMLALALWTKP